MCECSFTLSLSCILHYALNGGWCIYSHHHVSMHAHTDTQLLDIIRVLSKTKRANNGKKLRKIQIRANTNTKKSSFFSIKSYNFHYIHYKMGNITITIVFCVSANVCSWCAFPFSVYSCFFLRANACVPVLIAKSEYM